MTLVDERGQGLASALIDRQHASICARVYHRRPGMAFDVEAAFDRAWQRRAALLADPTTDAYRLVHGEGDFVPGLRVERYGPVVVLVAFAATILPHLPAVAAAVQARLPEAVVVIREHLDDLRRSPVRSSASDGRPLDPQQNVACCELGVPWQAQPFGGLATGLYVDQRPTRAWLRQRCDGARVLNLFAYTGLFSISLLQAGAAAAVDVDLAAPALAVAQAQAQAIGVANRHRVVQADCRAALQADTDEYDIIIIDPPTAARGGSGWVGRRDYPQLLRLILPHLAAGGLVVAISNSQAKPVDLPRLFREVAPRLQPETGPSLGEDIPQLRGFPEGRPYRLVAASRRGEG